MRYRTFSFIAAAMLAAAHSASAATVIGGEIEPEKYIVVFNPTISEAEITDLVAATKGSKIERRWTDALNAVVLSGIDESSASLIAADPSVISVEKVETLVRPGAEVGSELAATKASPQINPPIGLDRIDQRATAPNHLYTYQFTGAHVHVYVVDSGIRGTHEDFRVPGQPSLSRVITRYNALPSADVDTSGHGTHVAGIVGGEKSGVAKEVILHSVRVCHQPGAQGVLFVDVCPSDAVIDGLNHIASRVRLGIRGSVVVNMSLERYRSDAMIAAIDTLKDLGVFVVTSAGNSTANICDSVDDQGTTSLAEGNHVVASVSGDKLLYSSNYGSCIFMSAPGGVIRSASIGSDTDYYNRTGSSQAAPHVAGAAALIWQEYPAYSVEDVAGRIIARATTNLPLFSLDSPDDGETPARLLYTLNFEQ